MAAILSIIGVFVKINIDIGYIKSDIENLTAKMAQIDQLKSKSAEIDSLTARLAEIDKLLVGDTSVGKFKSTCPFGTSAVTVVTSSGLEVVCH